MGDTPREAGGCGVPQIIGEDVRRTCSSCSDFGETGLWVRIEQERPERTRIPENSSDRSSATARVSGEKCRGDTRGQEQLAWTGARSHGEPPRERDALGERSGAAVERPVRSNARTFRQRLRENGL